MSYAAADDVRRPLSGFGLPLAVNAAAADRKAFIQRTYGHLAVALLAFAAIDAALLALPGTSRVVAALLGSGSMAWLAVLGGFMVVSFVADRWARSSASLGKQYLGLGLYVVAEAIIFVPMLFVAKMYAPQAIPVAGVATLALFTGLTAIVFTTGADFSFLRGVLTIGGFVALGLIVCGALFGFELGTFFTVAMIAYAGGAVLYQTSAILHEYRTDQHVAAALALFAAVALLLWYVLRLVMAATDR